MAAIDSEDIDRKDMDSADPLNRVILELGAALAKTVKSELHVVHAWYPVGERLMRHRRSGLTEKQVNDHIENDRIVHRDWVSRTMNKANKWINPKTLGIGKLKTHLIKAPADKAIPATADKLNADLIIMGTVARTGISGFFIGNTAERILGQIDCSVFAVKPDGFETPVSLETENSPPSIQANEKRAVSD